MPTWNFKCSHCHHVEERMFPTYAKMRISEDLSALHCQKCGCELIRQIATPAFHLKGAGFHSVDYKGVK